MNLLIAIAVSLVFVAVFGNRIRQHPVCFYVLAILLDVLMLVYRITPLDTYIVRSVSVYMQRGLLAVSLFAIVMFIGAFPDSSKVSRTLRPIRGELSIIAGLLVIGHMVGYLSSYATNLLRNHAHIDLNVLASLVLAIILLLLLSILLITSFRAVKQRMQPARWKRVQWLAYPFFGAVYVHIMLMILPSALHGGSRAIMSVAIYTIIFGAYAVMRWYKGHVDTEKQVKHRA